MERTAVRSRDIAIVGYDEKESVLEITFRGGGVYQYQDVPEAVYRELMAAPSHGNYLMKK